MIVVYVRKINFSVFKFSNEFPIDHEDFPLLSFLMFLIKIIFYHFYLPAPCGSRSTGSEGTVLSPNYPKNYSVDHNCVYSIAVPKEFGK